MYICHDPEYSIKHSKVLGGYKGRYPYTQPFQESQAEDLIASKQITDSKSKFYVTKILRELHCTLYAHNYIEGLKNVKYNSADPDHESKLLQIWKNLKPDQKPISPVSQQWINIGFQVENPATDFRGAGFLGLINLSRFSSTSLCHQLFEIASAPDTEYFFASASLYLTMLASEVVGRRQTGY